MRVLVWIIRLVLVGVFLAAALPKIADPAGFAKAINNYHILPGTWVNPAAIFLPWLELICALCLLFVHPLRRGAEVLFLGMLLVFIAAQAIALAKGLDISCGCFSVSAGKKAGMQGIYLNAALSLGLIAGWFVDVLSRDDSALVDGPRNSD